jgi:hypothetical protein
VLNILLSETVVLVDVLVVFEDELLLELVLTSSNTAPLLSKKTSGSKVFLFSSSKQTPFSVMS